MSENLRRGAEKRQVEATQRICFLTLSRKINLIENVRISAAIVNWRRREAEKDNGVKVVSRAITEGQSERGKYTFEYEEAVFLLKDIIILLVTEPQHL